MWPIVTHSPDQQEHRNIFVLRLVGILKLIVSPIIIILFFFLDLIFTTSISADATHVPTFYAPMPTFNVAHISVLFSLTLFFGIPHILGYPFTTFPTIVERKLWFATSLVITLGPLAWNFILGSVVSILQIYYKPTRVQQQSGLIAWLPPKIYRPFNRGRRSCQAIVATAYAAARIVLIALAVAALRRQPDDVFRVLDWTKVNWKLFLDWTKYFPHISS